MSRGPGKAQRLILDTLEEYGPYYLAELAGSTCGARYKSLHRAACRLDDEGQISLLTYPFGARKVAVGAPGVTTTTIARKAIEANTKRLSVEVVSP